MAFSEPADPAPAGEERTPPDHADAVPHVLLLGSDYPALGDVAVRGLGDRAAIALSPGRYPKPYPHLDPNEDAALVARGPGAHLLVAADGHSGFDAARAAVAGVAARRGVLELDPLPNPARVVRSLLRAAQAGVRDALLDAPERRAGSRTTLAIALITPGRLHAATWGDSTVARVRGSRAKPIGGPTPFLDARATPPDIEDVRLRAGDHVLVASDGFTDYARDWPKQAPRLLAARADVTHAARDLVEAAWAGGAGDHVAVGIARVAEE